MDTTPEMGCLYTPCAANPAYKVVELFARHVIPKYCGKPVWLTGLKVVPSDEEKILPLEALQ